jgi:phosphoserine phosphatase
MTGRLAVLDVDSTLITTEVIDMLAARAGAGAEVAAITESAMRGEMDFAESLKRRVATLEGLPASVCDSVRAEIRFTPGAENFVARLHREGWIVALVSGGFSEVVGPLAAPLGITLYRANSLECVDGFLTGRTFGPVVDRAGKATALREFAADAGVALADTVAIGDGANDLDMMAAAGLGIAFNAKPMVQERADIAINATRLDAILDVLDL